MVKFSSIPALVLAIFMCSAANASNVFLVQLGSYPTENESKQAWNEIKATMQKDFAGLSYQLSALSLPPAGRTVYRLQSGPFTLRNQASDFCEKLKASGQDCFVVESAAFAPKEAPIQPAVQVASKVKEKPQAAPKVEQTPAIAPAAEKMKEAVVAKLEEPKLIPAEAPKENNVQTPSSLPDTRKGMMVVASATNNAQAVTPPVAVIPAQPALPSLSALQRPSFSLSDEPAPEKQDAEVDKEFTAAFNETPVSKPAAVTPPTPKPQIIKPAVVAAPAPAKTQPAPVAKKDDVVIARADVFDSSIPQAKASSLPNTPVQAASAIPFAIVDKSTGKVVSAPNARREALLPPPGASGATRQVAKNTVTPQPSMPAVMASRPAVKKDTTAVALASAAPVNSPESPFVEGRGPKFLSFGSAPSAGQRRVVANDRISPTDRRVEIDEAIQVPLSEAPARSGAVASASPSKPKQEILLTPDGEEVKLSGKHPVTWGATPSRNVLQHSYWVQLSHFKSDQAALNYWQTVKSKLNASANGMRVRITRPLSAGRMNKRVSLQVGPFIEESDVSALCSLVAAEDISCQMAKDIGVSTVAGSGKRVRDNGRNYQDRRDVVMMRPSSATPRYWLQLGSYRTQYDAEIAWLELRDTQPALQPYQPSVMEPKLSSSEQQVYRLRTGPFQIRTEAENVCGQLQNVEIGCVIVSE